MKLPESHAEAFQHETGHAPLVVARAMYDLAGSLGETYVATDAQMVMLFSRSIRGAAEQRTWRWAEVALAAVHPESLFSVLELQSGDTRIRLQFSGWDQPALRQMVELWEAQRPDVPAVESVAAGRPSLGAATAGLPSQAIAAVSPLVAFCAGIHAMIQCDEHLDPAELQFLNRRVPDPTAIQAGHDFLLAHGLDTVCASAQQVLSDVQKRCLLANLMGVAMVDGALQSKEQELLDQLQTALNIPEDERADLFAALMTKNNLGVFEAADTDPASADADGLTPCLAYGASFQAMMAADQTVRPDERELLVRTVPHPEDVRLGQDYLQAYGLDHLLSRLRQVLNALQQRCLLANLIALAMVDGVIRSAEHELLDRFQAALDVPAEECERLYSILLLKNNLAVFAEA